MDRKLIGPALNDVAAKYKGDKDAAATLAAKLKEGKGHPQVAATDAELKAIVGRVLSAPAAATAAAPKLANPENAACLGCHGNEGFGMPGADGKMRPLHVRVEEFEKSVHAPRRCVDCHSDITEVPHQKKNASRDDAKLVIVKNCGGCHAENLKSYKDTYHGQVTTLGYAYTATCFDCHGTHGVLRVKDPASTVHPDNRLQTCQKCHAGATQGFVTFQPHANNHDFERYPHTWIASRMMIGLLAGTFAFFWLHGAFWFYREYRDRKQGTPRPHVMAAQALQAEGKYRGKYYQRFSPMWRVAHLVFALSLMVLTLTGMTFLYAGSSWAPVVVKALGGPQSAALIHRVCAVIFAAVFFAHLAWMAVHVARNWKTFKIFGPNSLMPRWQDLWDMIAMFKWFVGKGPRPKFDRWTYWEKFDYWAPFWGVTIIGVSGFMMWFPALTASFLPGWTFNVAMIAHGEEAFLAAVFLFTVHFFNNHFRPDKFPIDIVMFTGAVPLHEFRREHTLEYSRLVQSGELARFMVDAPSAPMTLGSKVLGFTLIAAGLGLLALVLTGFLGTL